MNNSKPPLKPLPRPPSPELKREIMWGGEDEGSDYFPMGMEVIRTRRRTSNPKPLKNFLMAFMGAEKRIWIVDEYFLIPDKGQPDARVMMVINWLHLNLRASDIRILTKSHAAVNEEMLNLFEERESEINAHQARRLKQCRIQINTNLKKSFNYIHDRFAIIDDELWHFGATVGGFHTSVNAASRGWCAIETGAIDFFELAWEECEGK